MATELRAGISFSADLAQTILVEIQDHRIELKFLEERRKASQAEYWFLDDLLAFDKKTLRGIAAVSVALDNRVAFFHRFPLDSSLAQVDQNEQVQWELSHFIHEFKPHDYISDVHILRTHAREQYVDALVVAVPSSFIFNMQGLLAQRDVLLQTVEVNHIAAEHALRRAHPELKARHVVFVGVEQERVDTGVLARGRLTSYDYKNSTSIDESLTFVKRMVDGTDQSDIVLHGSAVSSAWVRSFRAGFGSRLMVLNPFRQMLVSPSCLNFKRFIGREHHFAACVGSTLRR